jgi:hypothetical protein
VTLANEEDQAKCRGGHDAACLSFCPWPLLIVIANGHFDSKSSSALFGGNGVT